MNVNVGAPVSQLSRLTGDAGELLIETEMFGWEHFSVNVAAPDVTAVGLVMTIVPDPLAVFEPGVNVAGATAWVPAPVKVSVCVAPVPLGSCQW